MKCASCGAETQGKFCEYCGSEMPQEKTIVNITNNYYCDTTSEKRREVDRNLGKCPKCGNSKIAFKRERVGTLTQSGSRKKYIGTGRKGQTVSQSAYRTIGVCQTCGCTWTPNVNIDEEKKGSDKKIWIWVLGWICFFPIPLTILILRKKDMKPVVKYGIIAIAWLLFFIIGIFGNSETDTNQTGTFSTPEITTEFNTHIEGSDITIENYLDEQTTTDNLNEFVTDEDPLTFILDGKKYTVGNCTFSINEIKVATFPFKTQSRSVFFRIFGMVKNNSNQETFFSATKTGNVVGTYYGEKEYMIGGNSFCTWANDTGKKDFSTGFTLAPGEEREIKIQATYTTTEIPTYDYKLNMDLYFRNNDSSFTLTIN